MNKVSFSQHNFHPHLNVVTIDSEQVNGLWNEGLEFLNISMNASCNDYDYFGDLLKDYSDTRDKINLVENWINETYKNHEIIKTSGWSTKNQFWREWTIKK